MTCRAYKSLCSRKSGSFVLVSWKWKVMESTSAETSTQTIKDDDWDILQTISEALESRCNLKTICKVENRFSPESAYFFTRTDDQWFDKTMGC